MAMTIFDGAMTGRDLGVLVSRADFKKLYQRFRGMRESLAAAEEIKKRESATGVPAWARQQAAV